MAKSGFAFKAGITHIIHSNLSDAINDCARSLKCTMVLNHKGYKHDFRLCKGIPIKTKNENVARRNMMYIKGKYSYIKGTNFFL